MSHIISILRAAHCRSTHHYFAIDALDHIETAAGERLGNILLKYHDDYLIGAKAPDKSFRDFQNHVLHVGDNHWGGAPKACEKWRLQALEHLNAGRWRKAAYAMGVLSHYFTDPFMPLHTAQSDAESVVHRPMEWSVFKAYPQIQELDDQSNSPPELQLSASDDWISKAVTSGASIAHCHYHRLIELYNLERGVKNPPEGLNLEARKILAQLFALATNGWGQSIARIADEAQVEIPTVSLALTSLLATIDMPLAWVVAKISGANEQRAVQAIFNEYTATGKLSKHLPQEVSTVASERAKSRPLPPPRDQEPEKREQPSAFTATAHSSVNSPGAEGIARLSSNRDAKRSANSPAAASRKGGGGGVDRSSDLVDAPSIGPKTAARFEKLGIVTIGAFLDADCQDMHQRLQTRWITTTLLEEWQDQARLVCDVPALCGYKAQLLVAAECRDSRQLAAENPEALYKRIENVCVGIDGQRILRSAKPPTVEDVANWIADASRRASRAA